jgi:peptide/nickel transport system substrate-binding protein
MRDRRRRGAACAAAALALLLAACGGSGLSSDSGPGPEAARTKLTYALSSDPRQPDPLLAVSRADQIVDRQVHEPLVDELAGPFNSPRQRPGLTLAVRPSSDREIWSLHLRSRVRFQDGSPFNANAVLANVTRWRTLAPGRGLLPGLLAADAPRPDIVRLIFGRPVPDVPRRLGSPRLGIVSPAALRPQSGRRASLVRSARSGTGPFEFRGREADSVIVARNIGWWGSRLDLGPALDQIEFGIARARSRRLDLLRGGTVQVADSLRNAAAQRMQHHPLLTSVGARGAVVGLERSVRGIHSRAVQSLSGVWLTSVGAD